MACSLQSLKKIDREVSSRSEHIRWPVAIELGQETTVTLKWIAEHLQMGSWSYLANNLYAYKENNK
jgi:hypothetical protein